MSVASAVECLIARSTSLSSRCRGDWCCGSLYGRLGAKASTYDSSWLCAEGVNVPLPSFLTGKQVPTDERHREGLTQSGVGLIAALLIGRGRFRIAKWPFIGHDEIPKQAYKNL